MFDIINILLYIIILIFEPYMSNLNQIIKNNPENIDLSILSEQILNEEIIEIFSSDSTIENVDNTNLSQIKINLSVLQKDITLIAKLKPSYNQFLDEKVLDFFKDQEEVFNSLTDEVKMIFRNSINHQIKNKHTQLSFYSLINNILICPSIQKFCKTNQIHYYELRKYNQSKELNNKTEILMLEFYHVLNVLPLLKKIQNKNQIDVNLLLVACFISYQKKLMNVLYPSGFNKITQNKLVKQLLNINTEKLAQNHFIFKLEQDIDLINDATHPYYVKNFVPQNLINSVFLLSMEKEFSLNQKAYEEYKLTQRYFEKEFNIILNNTSLSFYQNYNIEFIKDEQIKNYDKRVKPFVAAGTCYYNDKISMNINEINHTKKWGTQWSKLSIKNIFFHELGHAVDEAWRQQNFMTYDKNHTVKSHRYSQNDFLNQVNKQCFNNFKLLSKKSKEKYTYYVKPIYVDILIEDVAPNEILNTPHLKKVKRIVRSYNYSRSRCEGFAECFSKIILFLLNGYNEENYFAETRDRSSLREFVKTMKPMLIYLLENIDWVAIGVPKRNLIIRKIEFRRMIDHLSSMPKINRNATEFSGKVHRQKKMLRQRYQ